MATTVVKIALPVKKIAKITKWKVKKGQNISKGTLLCLYETDDEKNQKLKSNYIAKVNEMHANPQDPIQPGQDILTIEPIACSHPTVMKDMCADCGTDLRRENGMAGDRKEEVKASVAMVHCIPELIVSEEMAQELGKADEENLLRTRKLVLLVDLDQTLVHTTNDNIPSNLKDVYHFQLWHGRQLLWYHTRLRPRTKEFLEKISKLYELHICTFGVRLYAHTIARFLDPEEKYFSHRILSRDECFDATSKVANLKALFPCGDSMVCIIDDREDVWNFSPNLVHVKPYRFFQGTADINAPEGLTKTENDDKPVVHMVRKISQSTDLKEGSEEDNLLLARGNNGKSSDDKENRFSDGNREPICSSVEEKEKTADSKSDEMKNNSTDDDKEKYSTKERKTINSSDDNEVFVTDSQGDKNVTSVKEPRKGKSDEESDKSEDKECGSQSTEDVKKDDTKKDTGIKETDTKELVEWDDDDDYLFYLEEILTRIHKAFYDFHDQLKTKSTSQEKPNLKYIIPYVRKKTLKNCNIVFSGVIPTNMPAEKSRAYNVAKTLGANIQSSVVPSKSATDKEATTHLIAAKLGTSKIKLAMKFKDIHIVTPDWLWNCYERWEHVEEALFPLSVNYCSVAYCDSPNLSKVDTTDASRDNNPTKRKSEEMEDDTSALNGCSKRGRQEVGKAESVIETPSSVKVQSSAIQPSASDSSKSALLEEPGPSLPQTETKFSFTYNPLYSFSDDDLECMDKEVEDIMEEGDDDSSSEDEEERDSRIRNQVLSQSSSGLDTEEESTRDSLSADFPKGWSVKDQKSSPRKTSSDEEKGSKSPELDVEEESETELEKYEKTMEAFAPDSEGDSDEYQDSIGSVDEEIAEAVEKELMRD